MFWDKKEKKLPDLPESSYSASIHSMQNNMKDNLEDEQIHELPSFPDSPMKKGFSQSAIKDAVSSSHVSHNEDEVEHELPSKTLQTPSLPRLPRSNEIDSENNRFKLTEMEEWAPPHRTLNEQDFDEDDEEFDREELTPVKKTLENKPVFIKIDKFRSARDSLAKVESGLQEIEDLLHHIREVKAKEDQELLSWEKDMDNIKSRISNVLADVFERAEI